MSVRPLRERRGVRSWALTLSVALVAAGAVVLGTAAGAQAATAKAFTLDYSQQIYGDFVEAGNSSVVCPTAATANPTTGTGVTVADCATAQNRQASANGTTYGNDSFNMQWANPATNVLNSSQAELEIPAGASVAFARLNWSGDTGVLENANGNGQTAYPGCGASATAKLPAIDPGTAYNAYNTEPISLVANGTTSTYSPATNLQTDATSTLTANQAQYYSTYADVTTQLQGLASGSEIPLTVQNLWSPTGYNCYGGWSLMVVWKYATANANAPIKKLVNIYNGHVRQQSNEADTTISIPNLKLANSSARIGVTAYEGDYNISGDELEVDNTPVADPLTSGNTTPTTNNFFVGDADGNGSWAGNTFTSGPSNVFSVDAKTFTTTLIAPNANTTTTATFTFHTTQDSYVAQELAFSAAVPDIVVTKSTTTTVAEHGGTAPFTITVQNPTPSAISNVSTSDPTSPGCNKTIGTLAGNATVTYTCTGNVPDDGSTSYTNTITATGTDYTGSTVTGTANATVITVIHPAITLTKTADKTLYASGDTVTYTITAKNTGDSTLTNVKVTDTNASSCVKTVGTLASGASNQYTCTATAPVPGGSNVAAVSGTDAAGGTVSASATAATPTAGSVSGNVFADLNNDGKQGSGETGIPNVTFTLTPATGTATTTTSTKNGGFTFTGVAPGTYTLTETQPTGYGQGTDTAGTNAVAVSGKTDTFTVTVPDAGSSSGTTFGEIPSDSLAGSVYVDANDDGVKQSGEAGVTGVTLNLSGADDVGNKVSLSTQTTSTGAYSFPALRPGTYTITEVQPAGYVQGKDAAGTPAGVTSTQDVISGITLTGTNTAGTGYTFGELIASSVSGTVQTDNGTALAGVTVTLTGTDDNNAAVSTTATTATNGTYVFTNLRPGTYAVTETQPTAYGAGSVTAGPTGGTVGGANSVTAITLPSNTSATGYAFVDTTGSVSGTVFSDANNDGVKAASGEPGLGGTTVTLTGTGGGGTSTARTFNLTTTTATDGTFSFPDLPAGTAYTLTEQTPPSYLNGKDTAGKGGGTYASPDTFSGVTVTAATAETGYLFGEVAPGSLAGTVTDQNGNPEVGVKVDLGGAATATATSGNDGSYSFTNLYPGTYTLAEEQPTGLGNGTDTVGKVGGTVTGTASTVNSITAITVPAGGVGSGYVFTDVAGSLAGHAYVDANSNGKDDSGETAISGVTITLSQGSTTVATTTTATDGSYTFSGLAAGSYTITETQPGGYFEGSAGAGTPAGTVSSPDVVSGIALTAGATGTGYDFGDLLAASLAGTVKDGQGNPIAGVTVTASGTDMQGKAIAAVSVKTGTDGSFSFAGLSPGTYQVVETQPTAYGDTATTPATVGSNGGAVSGTNTITGIALGSKAAATGYAFVDSTATISGSVYIDANGDGTRQSSESGIKGVTVTVSGGPNTVTVSTTTAADGSFSLPGLLAGTYALTEAQPNAYTQGTDQAGTTTDGTITQTSTTDTVSAITVAAGASLPGYTFGEYTPTGLSGIVTDDQGNPLRAVTVSIKNSAGTVVATTTTNASGVWSVLTLAPGTYEIDETQPAGYGNGSAIVGTVNGASDGTAAAATPNAITGVTIASGQSGANYQFVDASATISGTVFVDANGNNALDSGEAGITNVTVTATGTVGGNTVTRTGTSTSTGAFTIKGLPAGTYTVTETQPGGYTSGTDTAGTSGTAASDGLTFTAVAVTAGGTDAGYLYPEYAPSSLAGTVMDGAGNPIAGVTVTVKAANGTTATATTTAAGAWSVTGLAPGTYSVIETQPADYGTGTDAAGSLGGTLTDGNTISGVVVPSGSAGSTYAFTDVAGTLAGTVFLDKNDDGVQQSGDSGIGGVTLTVTGTTTSSKTSISRTATTASDGTFTVTGLPAGTYQLVETQPSAYQSGIDTAGTPTGTLSATNTFAGITMGVATTGTGYTFGEYATATVAGLVRDTAFKGLSGATITLSDGHGHTYTPTLGTDGTWTATGVVPGTYTITETNPAGYGDVAATPGTDGGTATDLNHISGVAVTSGSAGTGYTFVDRLGSLSGSVYVDANGNGVRDSGENGVSGVTVTLSSSGATVGTATTDSSGNYSFTAVPGGTYTITETQPTGYAEGRDAAGTPAGTTTTQDVISGIALPNGTLATGYTFGEESLGSIAGTATVGGAGEGGVTVTLTGTTDQGVAVSLTATTAASTGTYTFTNVSPGTYSVTETQPAAYGAGTATAGSSGGTVNGANQVTGIALAQGVAATGYGFTDAPAMIAGTVFSDANGNNVKDTGERGLSGVALSASNGTTTYNTTTASDGTFTFANLPAGTYTVTETQPTGYSSGTDSAPSGTFSGDTLTGLTVSAGATASGILYPETTTAALSGGVQDSAGNPLAGVTVTATLSGGGSTSVTTDAQGTFAFATLNPGMYTITETQPAGYGNGSATAGPVGTDGAGGGTVSGDGNSISNVAVVSGDMERGYVFTDTSSTLTGAVFVDANGDNVRQTGEAGLSGVTVTATGTAGAGDNDTFTATTGSDGTFTLTGLLSGTYTLTETQPSGYLSGTDTPGSPTSGTASTDGVTVTGIAVPVGGTAGGYLYPEYQNGGLSGTVSNPAGAGIPNATVTATNAGGTVVGTATTASDGTWSITGLTPGTYTVKETDATGYGSVSATPGSDGGVAQTDLNTITGVQVVSGGTGTGYGFTDTLGTISGSVYVDANHNGVFDSGETAISNVTVTLSTGGTTVATATTRATGSYTFTGLAPGTYTITETQPAAYAEGLDTVGSNGGGSTATQDVVSGITLAAGKTDSGYLFGEETFGSLSGTVSVGGSVENGVTVTITGTTDTGATYTSSAVTTGGQFSFTSVPPGSAYTLSETQPARYGNGTATAGTSGGATDGTVSMTNPNAIGSIAITQGASATGYAFTDTGAQISGTVFVDRNGDGVDGSGDTGINGVTVTATDSTGHTYTGVTGTTGAFTISVLGADTYTLTETQPAGYTSGADTAGTFGGTLTAGTDTFTAVQVTAGNSGTGYTFAEYVPATLSGSVLDSAGNGIAGVTVTLTGPSGTFTLTTDKNGAWTQAGLEPGTYTLAETQPTLYGAGSAAPGSDGGTATDANDIGAIAVTSGSTGTGYTFTDTLASIAGAVYLDANGNGVRDGGETGIQNVTLTLTGGSLASPLTTTTLSTGGYTFANLLAGTYTVTETQPAGYAQGRDSGGTPVAGDATTTQDVVSKLTLAGGVTETGVRFAEESNGSVSGTVTVGGNGETGITLTIAGTTDQGSPFTTTTTTGSTGAYSFATVPPGTYTVTETQPAQYGNGTATVGSSSGTVSSDGNSVSGIVLNQGSAATGYAFTDVGASIGGRVFDDHDGDNAFDGTDTGLSGDTVTATGSSGTYTATSGTGGVFTLVNLPTGTYVITEQQPTGYLSGTDSAGTTGGTVTGDTITGVTPTAGGSYSGVLFPEHTTSTVAGTVLDDHGKAIPGVLITVTGGGASYQALSQTDGSWSIPGIPPGTYTVSEAQPAGYGAGSAAAARGDGTPDGANEIDDVAVQDSTATYSGYAFTDATTTIAGTVFDDSNNNGTLDPGESGVSGVTVSLVDPTTNAVVGTATTGSDGTFTVSDVVAGTYSLLETQPAGYGSGTDTAGSDGGTPQTDGTTFTGVTVQAGVAGTGYLYAEYRAATLGGTVVDSSGKGVPNVTVTVEKPDGTVVTTLTTDVNGSWVDTSIVPGTYQIVETQPTGYGPGSAVVGTGDGGATDGPNTITGVAVTSGSAGTGYGFVDQLGSLAGGVYIDANGDGMRDAGDGGIGSVTVTLTGPGTGAGSVSTTTDAAGDYSFPNLVGGTYSITETQPSGYTQGLDVAGTDGGTTTTQDVISAITLGAGDAATGYWFGEENPSSISGSVLVGDAPEPGVLVDLSGTDDRGNTVARQATVAANGTYTFAGVARGTYAVSEEQPAAYGNGTATVGTAGGTASTDGNSVTNIVLNENVTATGYAFTDVAGTVSGRVYVDNDGSNTFTTGDTGLGSVSVTATSGGTTYHGVTASDGTFTVGGLPAGTYALAESPQPAGYTSGTDGAGTTGGTVSGDSITGIAIGAGAMPTGVSFPEYQTASIAGTVLLDTGAGAAGVTIDVYDANGGLAGTTTTSGTGGWTVAGLVPGTYTVKEVQPTAYGAGTATPGPAGGAANGANEIDGVPVTSGGAVTGYAFTDTTATVSGTVFVDTDGDGAYEQATDTPLTGVTVMVLDSKANVLGTATSLADGSFAVTGLPAGTYTLVESQPQGYLSGNDTAGAFGGTASTDGTTVTGVLVTPGATGGGYLYPEYKATSVAGTVTDQYGHPLSGVTITVTNSSGATVATATTDVRRGAWLVTTLPPGTYTVTETQPTGYGDGTATPGTGDGGTAMGANVISGLTVKSGSTGTAYDFTDPSSALSGYVYGDTNGDGIEDGAETGIAAVTLTVETAAGTVVGKPTTTATDGTWSITGLPAGTYTLVETQPAGYASGTDTVGMVGGASDGTDDGNGTSISTITLGDGVSGTGYAFAEYVAASLGGTILDGAGNPLAGVTVTVSDGNGHTVAATTGSDGSWSIGSLPPGTYSVTETQPAGYGTGTATAGSLGGDQSTTDPGNQITGVVVTSGSSGTGYGFTDTTSSLAGTVYSDLDGDGSQGTTEPGLANVVVTVSDAHGDTVATTTTGSSGSYVLDGLLGGTYTVTVSTATGYAPGTATAGTPAGTPSTDGTDVGGITLGDGQAGTGYDFGELTSSLSGVVFLDSNDDGLQQADEPGLQGVTLTVKNTATGRSVTATTAADGSWSVTGLLAGTYSVTETQPAGYADGIDTAGLAGGTFQAPDTFTGVAVEAGTAESGYTFGEQQNAITGQVYLDTNGDSVHEAGEKPLGGVTIHLLDASGAVIDSTTTLADGTYAFAALGAGTYTVVEVQPAGYGSTTPDTQPVTLTGSSSGAVVDFGDRGGSIGSSVWLDTNGNGIRDAGEPGVGGVTLSLHDAAGAVVATTVSAADGSYTFTDLVAGTYTVSVTPPKGDVVTTEGRGTPSTGSAFSPTTLTTAPITISVDPMGTIGTAPAENAGLAVATPDLAVTLHGPAGPLTIGVPVTTTVTVTDAGNTTEPGAVVTVRVPPDMSVTAAAGTGYTCTVGARTAAGTIVTCTLTSKLQPGQVAPALVITTLPLTAGTTPLSATVRPTAGGADVIPTDNDAVMGVTIVSEPVVTVTPPASSPPATPFPTGSLLPHTGLDASGLVTLAVLSMLGGLGLLLLGGRRRRRGER